MADENDQYAQAIHASIASTPDGTVPLPLEAVQAGLMQGEPPELQQLVFALAVPQPGGYMVDAVDVPPVTDIGLPAAYVLGVDDMSLARPGAEFAARIGVQPIMVPGNHMGLLTRPQELADALLALL